MCGIVGYIGEREAAPILLKGLSKLEYRGYDSAGIAVINDGTIHIAKTAGRIAALYEKTDNGNAFPGAVGIGHTRWATHGAPTDDNAHPHISNDGAFAVVHNGIIENYVELREELIEKGYRFYSATDTEVIVHLLEMYKNLDTETAIVKTVARLEGSFALGIISKYEPGKLYGVRKSSPLIVGLGEGENFFASDITALIEHTKRVLYLSDGEMAVVSKDGVVIKDFNDNILAKKPEPITWSVEDAEKGGYEHFMMKEMQEEPDAVRKTFSDRLTGRQLHFSEFYFSAEYLRSLKRIVITACGSAYHAGLCGKYILERKTGIPVSVELAGEFRYGNPALNEDTLVIVISQSGETADTIAALKEAREKKAMTLAIVNVVGSTIANLADICLYTKAGPEIAVATTKGFTTQVEMLMLLAMVFQKTLGRSSEEEWESDIRELYSLPVLMEKTIYDNPKLEELAKRIAGENDMFFIGRNTDYAIALEGALKMKEISYIHAEAYAAGELKHGTIALIEPGKVVIATAANRDIYEKTISNIVEVKARGAYVIAITDCENEAVKAVADETILLPKTSGLFTPILEILPLQYLAYYVAKERGADIDKPKNLAKSVTVE